MLLNEGLLKSSRPVKDPCSTGTHKTQTVPRRRAGLAEGGGKWIYTEKQVGRPTESQSKRHQNEEREKEELAAVTDDS